MVDGDVLLKAASIEDSTLVAAPVGGVSGDGEGADLGNVVHDGVLVVGSEGVVSSHADHGGHLVQVVVALAAVSGGAGHVGPVGVSDGSEQLEVVEAELSDGASAASGAAAGESVGGAGGDLLGGELHQLPGGEVVVGLHLRGEGEGPAAAAGSLVLHACHGPLVHPVDGVRQLPGRVPRLPQSPLCRGEAGWEGLQAEVRVLELLLGQVSELVDAFLVRRPSAIVSLNLSKVCPEYLQSVDFFIDAAVSLLVFQLEVSEFLQSSLICQGESQED